ncbi:MAG: class I adenylate cyclase [Nitrospinae bacterium]|nr:class I adenylate cyclase [Nitrospinota bacterium]
MSENSQNPAEVLFNNRQAFLRYNQFKINRTLQTLFRNDRMVFTIIPRLLHVHQKGLPGYIEGDVPSGVYNFALNKESLTASERLFPDTIIKRTSKLEPVIHSVLLIGSVGSIAQTKKSDLDYTLLISKNSMSREGMELLKKKLQAIEQWTWETYHLETHFFLNDIEEVQRNIFGESDSESTGSALAKLLKEEMYRTAIVVAGKIPFWMIAPVESDDERYGSLYKLLRSGKTLLDQHEFVDMGNVDDISQGEFFGGSIWALIKSFRSPFKTLMKMGLLEEYMFTETKSNLLCHEIKRKVFEGAEHLSIDPYIMLFKRVEKYFLETKTENETDALRTAFYLKVGTQVSGEELESGSHDIKKSTLIKMIKEWQWPPHKVEQLNNYIDWQMMQKAGLGNRVNKILMNSYKLISEKNKSLDPSESLITERDTHLLGRKLFSFYRQAANKVENVFALVDGKTAEKELTFLLDQPNVREKGEWYLIRGKTLAYVEQIPKDYIIKKSATLQFLIAFAAFNNLYDQNTHLLLRAEQQSLKDFDLHTLLEQISSFIARVNIASIANQDLLNDATLKQLYVIIDFGSPVPREVVMGNIKDCRNNDEYQAFIHKRLERIQSITAIYLTSWGELFCKTFAGVNSMARCLAELGPQVPSERFSDPHFLKTYIPCGRKEPLEIAWLNFYMIRYMQARGPSSVEKVAS